MAINHIDQTALIEHHVVALRRGAAADRIGNEITHFARRHRVGDIDDAQAAAEPHRMHQRAGHALVELVGAKARARRAGERRIEFAHLEQRQRLHVGIVRHVEQRNAGMQPAAARLFFIGALRLILFVDGERDTLAADLSGNRHHRVGRFGKRRMIIVGRNRLRLADVGNVDDTKAAVPAAGEHLVAEAQRVVQAMALA